MAAKIRGITVEIGGDTTGLQKALKGVNGEINSTQKQLKDVEKLLKLDPSNLDLLQQKQKLLNDTVEKTGEKLDVLRKAEADLKASGVEENSAQFMALQREIISTENALKQATNAANSFNAGLASAAANLDKFSAGAGVVADKTKALSTAAAGALAGIGGMAYKAVQSADDLNTLSKQTGITTDELQKMQYASEMVDVSVSDITGALKKLKSNMTSNSGNVAEAFARLGINVTDASGELRDSNAVFSETLKALSKVTNETERDALAMAVFGKNADALAGIIDDGGEALTAYGEEAEALGLILSEDTLADLNDINDAIDTMKARAGATFTEAGAKAAEVLLPVLDKVIDAVGKVLKYIGNLDSAQIETIGTILAVVAAISPIAGIISKITAGVSGFLTFLPKLQTAFSAVTSFAAANPVLMIAAAVVALTALIIANWDKIKPILTDIWEKVKDVFEKIKNFVMGVIEGIKEALKGVANFFISMLNKIIGGVNAMIDKVNGINVKMPDWLGGKSIGFNLNKLSEIPALARGGVVSSGSAIVGEAGAELLTVANGRAMVQPLTNNYTTNNYTQGSPNVNVTFTGSLAQLARVLAPEVSIAFANDGKAAF